MNVSKEKGPHNTGHPETAHDDAYRTYLSKGDIKINGQDILILSISRQNSMDGPAVTITLFFLSIHVVHSQHTWVGSCITINLAPADLPKESGRFDLPIALGILAAAGQIPTDRLDSHEFAGELSLSGELRPIRGALAMVLAADAGERSFVLPADSAR